MATDQLNSPRTAVTAEQARRLADDFVWKNLGDLIGAGKPQHAVSPLGSVWVVPLIFSNASSGPLGVVGVIVVDDRLNQIVAATPTEEIKAAASG